MENIRNQNVGEIVARDFRTAEVFSRVGIDYCCGGKQRLNDACKDKGLDVAQLEEELVGIMALTLSGSRNFNEWEPDLLCDYILNTHHKFVWKRLPELLFYTQKIAGVHGGHHPELIEVAELFKKIGEELEQHLRKEELILFPAIKLLAGNDENAGIVVKTEIERMWGEHEFAGGSMDKINQLTGGYAVPADACNTYLVTLKMLKEFEDDLHVHVHLENNILFPKSIKLTEK